MKILFRLHPDKRAMLLCSVLGLALLLLYHKLLRDQGLLEHRRYKERELLWILGDGQRIAKRELKDSTVVDRWRETENRTSLTRQDIKISFDEDETAVQDITVNKNKYLIYLCNKQKLCGDWGTRQAGIISTFILANLTDRIFKVSMTTPCRLQRFLLPNDHNWIPNIDELRGKSFEVINDVHNSTFVQTLHAKDFNSVYLSDTVFIRATSDFVDVMKENPFYKDRLPTWVTQNTKPVFKHAWNMLMKPSEYIQTKLQDVINRNSIPSIRELTCVYVKTGNIPTTNVISKESVFMFLQPFAEKATKVFIATDSETFRNATMTKFGDKCLHSGGVTLDIDNDRKQANSCLGLETVIVDQLILTQCYVLVISKSTFGEMTAALRDTNINLFSFGNGKVAPYTHTV